MARSESSKSGIQYFPLDVNFNDNMNLFIAEKGLIGLGVIVCLWKKIYSGRGYYTEWNADIALLFSKSINLPADDKIDHYIEAALKRDIFNKAKYDEFGILTSEGIQERYVEATERRKEVKFKTDYLLIKVAKKENVCIYEENGYIFVKNAYKRQQIKSDQIKQNETKLNEIKQDNHLLEEFFTKNPVDDDEFNLLIIFDKYFNPVNMRDYADLLKIYRRGEEYAGCIIKAIDITYTQTGIDNPIAYINSVCSDLIANPQQEIAQEKKTSGGRRIMEYDHNYDIDLIEQALFGKYYTEKGEPKE